MRVILEQEECVESGGSEVEHQPMKSQYQNNIYIVIINKQNYHKKIIFKSIFAITIAIFTSSCVAFHTGSMSNSTALSSANFSYVKTNLKGEASATYVLGIGGFRETLVNSAKQNMLQNNNLRDNQALANLTVNFKTTYYWGGFLIVDKCTVTADLVEFNK